VQLLEQTLEEEEMTDEKLTRIAEQIVNPRATRMAGSGAGR
jgi:ferritin-like metal-binding protein YciE